MRNFLFIALAIFAATANSAESREVIPDQFHGRWAESVAACALSFPESILMIGERRVDFYDSRSTVLAIAVHGDAEFAVLLESTGEGETWLSTRHFHLSDDGRELTDMTGGRLGMKRILCREGR